MYGCGRLWGPRATAPRCSWHTKSLQQANKTFFFAISAWPLIITTISSLILLRPMSLPHSPSPHITVALALGNESRPGVYQTPCKTEIPLGKGSKVVIFFQQASEKQVKLKHLFIPTASQGTLNVKSALRVKTWSLPLVPLSLVNLQPFP